MRSTIKPGITGTGEIIAGSELISTQRRLSSSMPLLPRKGVLAVAAVIDVAMQEHGQPISAKALAARHGLPPRHLEPVLQALVRCGILRGVRGPRGGYELARDRRRVTANDILRAARTVEDSELPDAGSDLLLKIVLPAMANAETEFGVALSRINLEDMARDAQALSKAGRGTPRA
jgi:Rrf2 family transcriptional regulator, iron-sulfur cluster assembly transcription factor